MLKLEIVFNVLYLKETKFWWQAEQLYITNIKFIVKNTTFSVVVDSFAEDGFRKAYESECNEKGLTWHLGFLLAQKKHEFKKN